MYRDGATCNSDVLLSIASFPASLAFNSSRCCQRADCWCGRRFNKGNDTFALTIGNCAVPFLADTFVFVWGDALCAPYVEMVLVLNNTCNIARVPLSSRKLNRFCYEQVLVHLARTPFTLLS